jgi:hypothetical protein
MFKELASVGGTEGAQERLEDLEHIWQNGQERLARAMSSNATYVRGRGAFSIPDFGRLLFIFYHL